MQIERCDNSGITQLPVHNSNLSTIIKQIISNKPSGTVSLELHTVIYYGTGWKRINSIYRTTCVFGYCFIREFKVLCRLYTVIDLKRHFPWYLVFLFDF